MTLILVNAGSYLLCAVLLLRIPAFEPLPHGDRPHGLLMALTDRPFAAFTALNGAMGIQYQVPVLLLPLWLAEDTHAPRWTISAEYAVNALLGMALQVRI